MLVYFGELVLTPLHRCEINEQVAMWLSMTSREPNVTRSLSMIIHFLRIDLLVRIKPEIIRPDSLCESVKKFINPEKTHK